METDFSTVWQKCLDVLHQEVNEQDFDTWFRPIIPLRTEGTILTIQVPSQFFYEWLEEHFVPALKKAVHQVLGPEGKLEYSVVVDSGNRQNPPVTVNYPTGLKLKSSGSVPSEDYVPFSSRPIHPQAVNSRLNPA